MLHRSVVSSSRHGSVYSFPKESHKLLITTQRRPRRLINHPTRPSCSFDNTESHNHHQEQPNMPENATGAPSQQPPPWPQQRQPQVNEVYENQRWFGPGIGWRAPVAILDFPPWTDEHAAPISLEKTPLEELSSGTDNQQEDDDDDEQQPTTATATTNWRIVTGPSTDYEGWQYGTVYQHLSSKREGGRASQRFGDTVRRRRWIHCSSGNGNNGGNNNGSNSTRPINQQQPQQDEDEEQCVLPPNTTTDTDTTLALPSTLQPDVVKAMKERETEVNMKAIRKFIAMIVDVLSRQKLWHLLPWDPAAPYFLYKKHQQQYQLLQLQAYRKRLFTGESPAPPSLLRPGTNTLLQDMLCGAIHSRAAYGYAMAAGHIVSVTSYIKLATVQPLSFDAVAGVSMEANNESVAQLAGISPTDILFAHWRNEPYRPCHYVAIDRANQCVVISIRGSLQAGDMLSNLTAKPMEVTLDGVQGWVHEGMIGAATFIHCTTQSALQEAAKRCPGWPVLITGHSLGGGVAALLTLLIRQSGGLQGLGVVRCITMGGAAVMNKELSEACEEDVLSVVCGSDFVPHLSAASVEKLFLELSESSPVRQTATDLVKKIEAGAAAASSFNIGKVLGTLAFWKKDISTDTTDTVTAVGEELDNDDDVVVDAVEGGSSGQRSTQEGDAMHAVTLSGSGNKEEESVAKRPRSIPVIDLNKLSSTSEQQQQQDTTTDKSGNMNETAATAVASNFQQQQQQPEILPVIQEPTTTAIDQQEHQQQDHTMLDNTTTNTTTNKTDATPAEEGGIDTSDWEVSIMDIDTGNITLPPPPIGISIDTPSITTAVAQQQQASIEESIEAAKRKKKSILQSMTQILAVPPPTHPEVLFPPGRILWIFPADEHIDSTTTDTLNNVDVNGGGDDVRTATIATATPENKNNNANDKQQQQQQKEVEMAITQQQQPLNEMNTSDRAHQGDGLDDSLGASPNLPPHSQTTTTTDGDDDKNKNVSKNAGNTTASTSKKGVSMEEAAKVTRPATFKETTEQQQQEEEEKKEEEELLAAEVAARKKVPVVAEAERVSFERLLLMPDMLNDHFPDRYLQAIQQL